VKARLLHCKQSSTVVTLVTTAVIYEEASPPNKEVRRYKCYVTGAGSE